MTEGCRHTSRVGRGLRVGRMTGQTEQSTERVQRESTEQYRTVLERERGTREQKYASTG